MPCLLTATCLWLSSLSLLKVGFRAVYYLMSSHRSTGFVYITFNQYYGQVTGALYDARPLYLGLRFSAFIFGAMAGSILWTLLGKPRNSLNRYAMLTLHLISISIPLDQRSAHHRLLALFGRCHRYGNTHAVRLIEVLCLTHGLTIHVVEAEKSSTSTQLSFVRESNTEKALTDSSNLERLWFFVPDRMLVHGRSTLRPTAIYWTGLGSARIGSRCRWCR